MAIAVLFPIVAGLLLFLLPESSRHLRNLLVECIALVTTLLVFSVLVRGDGQTEKLLTIVGSFDLVLSCDGVGRIFAILAAVLWPLSTLYGFEYMAHEGGERHFFPMYMVSYGVTLGIAFAGNLLTMYVFYEFLSLSTLPLVMHGSSPESQRVGRKYMMYTFSGAALAFVGIAPVIYWGGNAFAAGGSLSANLYAAHPVIMQILFFCAFLGFAVKAAILPLHSWLPAAAVAPTPVTALLHAAAVVKAGAFAVIRVSYFVFGASNLRGSVVQAILLVLASMTIVYGALRAVREHHLKRRLAWSTVSNLSYILMAAALLTPAGMTGALSHLLFHAEIKITLFFCAGAILVKTGKTEIESMRGLVEQMPLVSIVYVIAALALSGTPLLPAFASKWMIGTAAFASGSFFGILGIVSILFSAILSAVYGLYPGFYMLFRKLDNAERDEEGKAVRRDAGICMTVSLMVLTVLIVLTGLFSNTIIQTIAGICAGV